MNEMAQWAIISLILWLFLGLDLDQLKESPKRISSLESQVTEQRSKINSLEKQISDINNKLQSVATMDDLQELQYENDKSEAVVILSDNEAHAVSELSPLVSYYNKNEIWINLASVGLLAMIFLALINIILSNQKAKAPVINIKSVSKNERTSRKSA